MSGEHIGLIVSVNVSELIENNEVFESSCIVRINPKSDQAKAEIKIEVKTGRKLLSSEYHDFAKDIKTLIYHRFNGDQYAEFFLRLLANKEDK